MYIYIYKCTLSPVCLYVINILYLLKFGPFCWRSAWLRFLPKMGNTWMSFLHLFSYHLCCSVSTHAYFHLSLTHKSMLTIQTNSCYSHWSLSRDWFAVSTCGENVFFNPSMHIASLICIHAPTLLLYLIHQQTRSIILFCCLLQVSLYSAVMNAQISLSVQPFHVNT